MGGDRWVVLLSSVVELNEYRQVQLTKKIEKREEHAERQNEKKTVRKRTMDGALPAQQKIACTYP